MSIGKILVAIERKRWKLYHASIEDRLLISRELDKLVVEYFRAVRGVGGK